MRHNLQKLTPRHWFAAGLFALALGMTVVLGVLASSDEPPSGAQSALLVVLAGTFQLWSASVFHSTGKADPGLARSSVRGLLKMASRAAVAGQEAQSAFESGNSKMLRDTMGAVSVHLSYIQEDALAAVQDWAEFHAIALQDVIEEAASNGTD